MGRRKGERRLADPVFKVADELMADGAEILNLEIGRSIGPILLPITPRACLLSQERRLGTSQGYPVVDSCVIQD